MPSPQSPCASCNQYLYASAWHEKASAATLKFLYPAAKGRMASEESCRQREAPAKDQCGPALAVLLDEASQVVIQSALKEEVCLGHGVALHDGGQLHRPHFLAKSKDALARHI